jgi:hypothetical protein
MQDPVRADRGKWFEIGTTGAKFCDHRARDVLPQHPSTLFEAGGDIDDIAPNADSLV